MTRTDYPAGPAVATGGPDEPERRLRARLRQALSTDLPGRVEAATRTSGGPLSLAGRRDIGREVLDTAVAVHSEAELLAGRALVGSAAEQRVVEQVLDEVFGLGGLQPLLADPLVETIAVNRYDRVFVQYSDGRRARVAPVAASDEELTDLIRTLAARASSEERRFDRGSPALNLQLPGGERLFAVLGLTAGGVTACTIRRHGCLTATLAQLRRRGTLDVGLERFLRALVRARKNVLITGGTGAGKTTLLRGLASEMDPLERIVTVEDAFELGLGLDPELHADVTALRAASPTSRARVRSTRPNWSGGGCGCLRTGSSSARSAGPRSSRCAGAGVLTGVVTGWIVGAVLAAAAAWFLPRLVGPDRTHRRRVARIEAIASWTEMLRDVLSAAAGLEQAVLATAPLAPAAIRGEVATLAARLESGQRLAPALRALARELDDPTADLVLAALVLAAERQAHQLGDLLGSLAATARGQAAMRMRVETGRARTRTSVRVIVATTLAFAAGVVLFNRAYLDVYDTATGQAVLLLIGALFAAGFAWLARIATSGRPAGVLALDAPDMTAAPDGDAATTGGGERS
ncbi:hypothetical protein GCM10009565_09280 [Amycolatopsis albidoflavus]